MRRALFKSQTPEARAPARTGAVRLTAPVAVLLTLAGCGIAEPTRDIRGARLEPHQVAEIVPGVQTRADVAALLGSPSATAPFGEDAWFYVSSVTRNRLGRVPSIERQTVVAIRFDERGVVREVKTLGLEDAAEIDPVDRVTPTPGTERSFLQLLLGNIGRFGGTAPTRMPGSGF
ncbi:MAG: outer membrane protein assembly factor BamE [Elioraea sp.]|nr:outer membrane protein assembly factor BamE [Elioraea sp.]